MSILTEPHRRLSTATVAAVTSAVLLGGCSFTARNVVLEPYAPADGLQAELGDLLVRNMLVVSEGDGAEGVVVGAFANRGEEDLTVLLEVGDSTAEQVEVPAGTTVQLGVQEPALPESGPADLELVTVLVAEVDPQAGGVVDLQVGEPSTGSVTLRVPVHSPDGIYAEFTPAAVTPAAGD